jgi:TatD DNase family protein
MMLDSHCHLNDDKLFSERKEVLFRANQEGVSLFLCIGYDVESSKKALQIAHEFKGVYAAVGLHPENLEGVDEGSLNEIKTLAQDPKVIAIGEIGLDYHWYKEEKDHENQKKWFVRQLDLANELHLPVSIHARDALGDTYALLQAHPLERGGVLHCYSGSTQMIPLFAQLGFYFGFDGPITYKNSVVPKENVRICPLDRILTETDSPYLTPVPFRGSTNEPCRIPLILQEMAVLKGIDQKSLENQVYLNFVRLFHVEQ